MRSIRVLDPSPIRSLDEYRANDGLAALDAARSSEPDAVIETVADAGLRGRGGAGFPTAVKWRTVRENGASSPIAPTVVVNAAEGEPGTFGDRTIMRTNPYRVLEGALIAAHAVGSASVIVATKERFTEEVERLSTARDDLVADGATGDVDIRIVTGPSHYLLGEETALLEVVAGRPPFPRIAPPYRHGATEMGDPSDGPAGVDMAGAGPDSDAPPTLVNNVETFAHVPGIVLHGPDWFRSLGTEDSPGTSVFTVTVDLQRGGVGEFPLGTSVREVIATLAGSEAAGQAAFVLSGTAAGLIAAEDLDTPSTFEALSAAGSGLGTGGFMVFTTDVDPVAVAHGVSRFLAVESCGQCTPCKQDGLDVADELDRLRAGDTSDDAIERIMPLLARVPEGARCDLGRQHERVVSSILGRFSDVAVAHATDDVSSPPILIAPIVDIDDEGVVRCDDDHQTKQPDWSHDERWSGKSPTDLHDVAVDIN